MKGARRFAFKHDGEKVSASFIIGVRAPLNAYQLVTLKNGY
jgi:hypothetical protein